MGKFHNGVLGTMTGKVGGVVGRTWKGINTVASYQPNVSNPRTNAQVGQRNKLTALTQLASQLNTGFIKPLWDRDAKKMSGFNAFIQANMASVSDLGIITYQNLIGSNGKMSAPYGVAAAIKMGSIDVNYGTIVTDAYGLASDKVYCAVIDLASSNVYVSSGVATRAEGSVEVDTAGLELDSIAILIAFRRADGSMTSNAKVLEV